MLSLFVENLAFSEPIPLKPGQTLLAALQAAGLDWAHACGGRGRCTTCRLRLSAGAEQLESETAAEVRFRDAGRLPAGSRLTCQAVVRPDQPAAAADLRGSVPLEGRLPHVQYR